MSPRALIRRAGVLLKQSGRVATGALARDRQGAPCEPHHKKAVERDAIGFLYLSAGTPLKKTDGDRDLMVALATLDLSAQLLFKRGIVTVNDTMGFDAVMQVYRQAWSEASGDPK
jgi:hypothetical protein